MSGDSKYQLLLDAGSFAILKDLFLDPKIQVPLTVAQLRTVLNLQEKLEAFDSAAITWEPNVDYQIWLTQGEVILIKDSMNAVTSWHPTAAKRVISLLDALNELVPS